MFEKLNDLKHLDPREFDKHVAVLAKAALDAQLAPLRKLQKPAKKAPAKKSGK